MKEPRFHGNVSERSHRTMSRIKGKDTKPELTLRKSLWANGIRYRKNYKDIPGRPDIVITKHKIAIFVDSEFFHGKDWETNKERIRNGSNGDYWSAKIEHNIERDKEKEIALKGLGYVVVRFWSRDVLKNPQDCVGVIKELIFDQKMGGNGNVEIESNE